MAKRRKQSTLQEIPAFAHECRIRDLYAKRLSEFRRGERLLATEHTYASGRLRADMRTLDPSNRLRVWEFKLLGSYDGLGQLLTYLAQARLEAEFARPVSGVLAAFEFMPEIVTANEVLNLGIEFVEIPSKLRLAGGVPTPSATNAVPQIPSFPLTSASLDPNEVT